MSEKKLPGEPARAKGARKPATGPAEPGAEKPAARPGPPADAADGESAVVGAIAAMPGPDRAIGERLHAVIKASAPALAPKLWYGMPAYARAGKVVCFFRSAAKFKERYMTLGFNAEAKLDDGALWPVAYALTALTPAEEARIGALVRKAVGGEG